MVCRYQLDTEMSLFDIPQTIILKVNLVKLNSVDVIAVESKFVVRSKRAVRVIRAMGKKG